LRKADGDDAYHPFVTPGRIRFRIAVATSKSQDMRGDRPDKKEMAADRMIGGRDCLCTLAG
jgi:hypothetical protein